MPLTRAAESCQRNPRASLWSFVRSVSLDGGCPAPEGTLATVTECTQKDHVRPPVPTQKKMGYVRSPKGRGRQRATGGQRSPNCGTAKSRRFAGPPEQAGAGAGTGYQSKGSRPASSTGLRGGEGMGKGGVGMTSRGLAWGEGAMGGDSHN